MKTKPSSLKIASITLPKGFLAAGGACGIKANGKPDMTLIVADRPCAAAGVFTTNQVCSAPVDIDRLHLKKHGSRIRAIVCNSGNANASTGKPGWDNAVEMCRLVAQQVGCEPGHVLVSSTGVIGRPLPMDKVRKGIITLSAKLAAGPQADADAASGIMTTDLTPKNAVRKLRLGGKTVHLAGICKGSGMIAPNLATMLVFLTTDADLAPASLKRALQLATVSSFNRISVDQHTSPSDTVLLLASGAAGNPRITGTQPTGDMGKFVAALTDLCQDLAYQIVQDGEGATKIFRIKVVNARNEKDADRVGRAVVDSPLVKTAVHGGDPNWGRITTAAGYSGAKVQADRLSLYIGAKREVCVFRHGQPTDAGCQPTSQLKQLMAAKEITFTLDLGLGKSAVEWLGCDLSRQYIAINADYTT